MDLLYRAYHAAFEKRGVNFNAKKILGGVGKFLATIPLWSAGSEVADRLTGGPKVQREDVYLPGPLYRHVQEQARQAKLKEQMSAGKVGV